MLELTFRIEFAAPFRVSTGHARPGVDATVDLADPLPATSLKGLMRGTLRQLLGDRHTDRGSEVHPLVAQVFGSAANTCAWAWTGATPVEGTSWCEPRRAARIMIGDNHVASDDMLGVAEQTQAGAATFQVSQMGPIDEEHLILHRAVLAISAEATRSLGADRRRGLGWVHITCLTHRPSREDIRLLLAGRRSQ